MVRKKFWVFDLDDTLMFNVHDYTDALLAIPRIIIDALGHRAPHVNAIMALEMAIDKRRIHEINPKTGEPFLYSMERFPGSCVEVYREICCRIGVIPHPVIEQRLWDAGMTAFDESRYRQNIVPGAKIVIDFLKAQEDVVTLITKGDPCIQGMKLAALRAEGICFDSTVITAGQKTPQMFRNAFSYYPGSSPISVGNSYRSDIAPALEAGYFGIYVPLETWETLGQMDAIRAQVDESRCLMLNDLTRIIEVYGRLP